MVWDPSRRQFLNAGLVGTIGAPLLVTQIEAAPANLAEDERKLLKTAMDEIIPATGGMLSASQVGAESYLQKLIAKEPAVGDTIHRCLARLDRNFPDQPQPRRVAALKKLEAEYPADFSLLRDSVYEAYYTNPVIWRAIGYELYPTDHQGPHLKPFDESCLAEIRKKPRHYREA